MELVTPAGRRVIVNRDAVVTIEPAMDGQTKTPIIGQATLLLHPILLGRAIQPSERFRIVGGEFRETGRDLVVEFGE